MAELLTSNLHMELEKTNSSFSRWAERCEDDLQSGSSLFKQSMEEMEHTIVALSGNDQQLEEVRAANMEIKAAQKAEFEHYMSQTNALKDKVKHLTNELHKYEAEEAQEEARLEKVREEHDNMRDKMEKTLNDLTHGIRLYTSLGLEFHKAEGECMKFVFTQISNTEPSKPYHFIIYVDDNDTYQLVETRPILPVSVTTRIITALNNDNNIGKFVVNMRKSFKAMQHQTQSTV